MQRPARAFGLALGVEGGGDARRIGIQLDQVMERRALFVELFYSLQVLLDERARRLLARLHFLLQVGNGRFLEIEN